MAMIPSGYYGANAGAAQPATSAEQLGFAGGQIAAVGVSAYDLAKAAGDRDRFNQAMATANLVVDLIAIVPGLAPFAGLQRIANFQMGLAHSYFAKREAKREAHRLMNKAIAGVQFYGQQGHHPIIAHRLAVSRIGINPETVYPLGSPYGAFNPETLATDTEHGLLLQYGEGPDADAAREARARELEGDLGRRPYPAYGMVPGPLVRLTRSG